MLDEHCKKGPSKDHRSHRTNTREGAVSSLSAVHPRYHIETASDRHQEVEDEIGEPVVESCSGRRLRTWGLLCVWEERPGIPMSRHVDVDGPRVTADLAVGEDNLMTKCRAGSVRNQDCARPSREQPVTEPSTHACGWP